MWRWLLFLLRLSSFVPDLVGLCRLFYFTFYRFWSLIGLPILLTIFLAPFRLGLLRVRLWLTRFLMLGLWVGLLGRGRAFLWFGWISLLLLRRLILYLSIVTGPILLSLLVLFTRALYWFIFLLLLAIIIFGRVRTNILGRLVRVDFCLLHWRILNYFLVLRLFLLIRRLQRILIILSVFLGVAIFQFLLIYTGILIAVRFWSAFKTFVEHLLLCLWSLIFFTNFFISRSLLV